MTNGTVQRFGPLKGLSASKRITGYLATALCVVATMEAGTANASLVGDEVTVGHYAPDNATPWTYLGASAPATFVVQAGTADIYTFYASYPFGYQVNVEASSILVDFSYLFGAAATFPASSETCSFVPPFPCTTVPMSFNGLGVSGLDDSSGNPLQSVDVDTNMGGWDSSTRLSFGTDHVLFDWKGLSFDNSTTFSAVLNFATPVPEPETYAMLLAGLGLLGCAFRRRKQ